MTVTTSAVLRLRHTRQRPLLVVVAVVLLLLVAVPVGLSQLRGRASSVAPALGRAQQDGSDSSESSAGSAGTLPRAAVGPAAVAKPGVAAPSAAPDVSQVTGAKVARSAWLGLQVGDLAGAAGRVRGIATAAGGSVLTEDISTAVNPLGIDRGFEPDGVTGSTGSQGAGSSGSSESSGRLESPGGPDSALAPGAAGTVGSVGLHQGRLTLSVPEPKLDGVLTELSTLGTVSYRSAQAQDVTATYIDTRARIDPARASIERVQALMAKSSDLQQLLALESELTRRQSDLDSLTQQLADLDRRTTMSDVTVTLWTPAAAEEVSSDSGVVASLRSAWAGLLGSLTVIVTGLAVLLPWLLLLGIGVLVWVRVARRRAGSSTGSSTAAPAATLPD